MADPRPLVSKPQYRDYRLDGPEYQLAKEKGLADAQWWVPKIERKTLRRLMKRDNWHALRDTAILFTIIAASGCGSSYLWAEGKYVQFAIVFWIYCTFYTSSADSRWHECGHGTAFKDKWMNDVLYQMASFMVFREPEVWRFSHARHHTDTDIVGRDPEVDARPLDMWNLFLAFFNVQGIQAECGKIWMHVRGELSDAERTFVPWVERFAVFRKARIWLTIYALTVVASIYFRSPLPMMYVFIPYSLGAWHLVMVGVFQHAGLAQDVLDHRLNTRTCYINPVSAFIYWNMHYHIEHHCFPMVPYYNLPELHKILLPQLPKPYNSIFEVYLEMIPALIKQGKDPEYCLQRELPPDPPCQDTEAAVADPTATVCVPDKKGWVVACKVDEVPKGELLRFDVGPKQFCVYHAEDDDLFYATSGLCTHGAADLGDGLIVEKSWIECPKHNGCFDFKTGEAKRSPARIRLGTFPVKVEDECVYVQVTKGNHIQIGYEKNEA